MIMWAGYVAIVLGLLEEALYATFTVRHIGGTQHFIIGLAFLAMGVLFAVYDGVKGRKEHAQIVAAAVICPECGLPLTDDCEVCPRCGKAVD